MGGSFQWGYLALSYRLRITAGRSFPCGGQLTAFRAAFTVLANDAASEIGPTALSRYFGRVCDRK
jgi:hypothetical protein